MDGFSVFYHISWLYKVDRSENHSTSRGMGDNLTTLQTEMGA